MDAVSVRERVWVDTTREVFFFSRREGRFGYEHRRDSFLTTNEETKHFHSFSHSTANDVNQKDRVCTSIDQIHQKDDCCRSGFQSQFSHPGKRILLSSQLKTRGDALPKCIKFTGQAGALLNPKRRRRTRITVTGIINRMACESTRLW